MVWKLFCFGRKRKASKALVCTDNNSMVCRSQMQVESAPSQAVSCLQDTGSDVLGKMVAVSKLLVSAKAQARQLDALISSPTHNSEAAFLKGSISCEGDCSSRVSLPCQDTFVCTSQAASCLSLGHEEHHTEEVSTNAMEDLTEGKQPEGVSMQCNVAVESDFLGVCANRSDHEALVCESMKQLCKNLSKHPGDLSPVLARAEAAGQGIFQNPLPEDGNIIYKSIEESTRDAMFRYSPDKAISSLKSYKLAWDDDFLDGHTSDPGVYPGEETLSLDGFSVMQDDGSILYSLALEGSPNPDSQSHVSGEVVENVSDETCGHCSEPTYHVTNPTLLSNVHLSGSPGISQFNWMVDASPVSEEKCELQRKTQCYMGEEASRIGIGDQKLKSKVNNSEEAGSGIFTFALGPQSLSGDIPSVEISSLNRVKEWISSIEQPDMPFYEPVRTSPSVIGEECGDGFSRLFDITTVAGAATRGLSASSTVAHMASIGLQEMPSLGVFNRLKTINLCANSITRIPAGHLPQSLHTLDLSRNRICHIEGFKDLTHLRILNLSYNKLSRIGHGLANCRLIKELYLAGNKIAEVDGLHRLLKLTVLDLSHNKIAASKALGQLAANYNSLMALNLLGNPILLNVGEGHLRKLINSLTPHVTYLNKQPICKSITVREAVVDNVAKAALGTTSQRNNKLSSNRVLVNDGVQSAQRKLPSHRLKDFQDKRTGSSFANFVEGRHHHHSHRHHDGSNAQQIDKGLGKEFLGMGFFKELENLTLDSNMHRSRSDGALHGE